MGNQEDILTTCVDSLSELTDEEIVQLNLELNWNDGQSRRHCEGRPWFGKIKSLFTEQEGREVHKTVRNAVMRLVSMRIESQRLPESYTFEEIHSSDYPEYAPAPDYHPLSREDVAGLLRLAKRANRSKGDDDIALINKILIRLEQGIPGMTRPRPAGGSAAKKSVELGYIFIAEFEKGDDPNLVDRIYALLQ